MDKHHSTDDQYNPYFDKDHVCQTPDAVFTTSVSERLVCVSVAMPFPLTLDRDNAMKLEHDLHRAVEGVLSAYFK